VRLRNDSSDDERVSECNQKCADFANFVLAISVGKLVRQILPITHDRGTGGQGGIKRCFITLEKDVEVGVGVPTDFDAFSPPNDVPRVLPVERPQKLAYRYFEQFLDGVGLNSRDMNVGKSNTWRACDALRFQKAALFVRGKWLEEAGKVISHPDKILTKLLPSSRVVLALGVDSRQHGKLMFGVLRSLVARVARGEVISLGPFSPIEQRSSRLMINSRRRPKVSAEYAEAAAGRDHIGDSPL
jgi:hypothetical protein